MILCIISFQLNALYKSGLSLIHHKLGSDYDVPDGPTPSQIDMYGHLQEVCDMFVCLSVCLVYRYLPQT